MQGCHFLRKTFHHQLDASLGRSIVRVTRPGDLLVNGADANDFSPGARYGRNYAPTYEFADGFACAQKLACQVDAQHGIPLCQSHFTERGIALQTCVVDEDVDRTELAYHLFEHLDDLLFRRDVGLVCEGVDPEGTNLGYRGG